MTSDPPRRSPPPPTHLLVFFLLAVAAENLDLWTKHVAEQRVQGRETIEWVPGVLGFSWVMNKGIIFGLFPDHPGIFLWISVLAVPLILVLFWTLRQPRWLTTIALGLILGGTLGNLYDRVTLSAVRDFLKLLFVQWPLFNLADAFICTGVAILAVEVLFFEPKKAAKPEAAAHEPAPSTTAPPEPASDSAPPTP